MTLVSIVIPAIDEGDSLAATLAALQPNPVPYEVILVDGGSVDRTIAIAREFGARVILSHRRQRAAQMNLGAQNARGDILLFLHADTLLPPGAIERIVILLSQTDVIGGAFVRRYASPSLVLRLTCLLARSRNLLLGWHLGDQAMFVRRSAFFQLGGFREVDQFEDLDLSRRLGRSGRITTLQPGVISSARRFKNGPARRTWRDLRLTLRYLLRGLPEEMAHAPLLAPSPALRT